MATRYTVPCVLCKGNTHPVDRWVFPQYIARRMACRSCGTAFETHERVIDYQPDLDIAIDRNVALPQHSTGEDDFGDYLDREMEAARAKLDTQ